jgi:hypothetical protein
MCRSSNYRKTVGTIYSNSMESDGSGSLVHTINLLDQCVTVLVDTGASVSTIPKYLLHKPVNFETAHHRLTTWTGEPVEVLGTFSSSVECNGRKAMSTFYVTRQRCN